LRRKLVKDSLLKRIKEKRRFVSWCSKQKIFQDFCRASNPRIFRQSSDNYIINFN
jgi:hypothetical protein